MSEKQYINAENIVVRFGEREVLKFGRLSVYEGERTGIVGANGAGKTTLLKLIAGEIEPDEGHITRTCETMFFRQFEEEEEGAATERDGRQLSLFGVKEKEYQTGVSGGESTRIRLAEVFSTDRALLMLDEPTSHLDMEGIERLKERLANVPTLLLISHNRDFMNEICTRIIAIEDGGIVSVDGNYDDYLRLREERNARAWTEYEQYSSEMKRLKKAYREKKAQAVRVEKKPRKLSSSDAKARALGGKRKPEDKARSKERAATNILKRMEHMEVKKKPKEEAHIRPDFRLTDPPENRVIISGEHIDFSYPNGTKIFEDASFRLERGARAALIGSNGAGKTTLIRMILERDQIRVAPKAKIGCFHQDMSQLDPAKTVLENIMSVSIQKESIARMVLSRMLFTAGDMGKKVAVLSGGERVKLSFAMLIVSDFNVLVLDEPTNFLDLPSLEAIEGLFSEYEGTMLFVSHDRAFIDAVATGVWRIEDKKIIKEGG